MRHPMLAVSKLLVSLLFLVAHPLASQQMGSDTEIFIPGGAFALDDQGIASYLHAGGCVSGQCFNSQGVWLPDEDEIVLAGTTFWIPTSWFDQEIEIVLYGHSGTMASQQVRIAYALGNLGIPNVESVTAYVGPEDSGGSAVSILTTTLGSTDPAPGGSVLVNQQYQGIQIGIDGDHKDNQSGFGILGLLVRLTGN